MLFKSVIIILSTVAQVAHTKSDYMKLEKNALEVMDAIDTDLPTHHARRLKKDKDNKKNKDDEEEEEKEVEIVESIEKVDATSLIAGGIRLSTLAADSTDWNRGTYSTISARSGSVKVYVPAEARTGDSLFLFLSRTDGLLPLRISGWKRGAECFKTRNRQNNCMRAAHCIERDGPYCLKFRRDGEVGNGRDLATVLFYRHLKADDPGCFTIDIPGGTTTWAIATVVTAVNKNMPIGRVSGTSCDTEWQSAFPSVYGDKDDVLLLSQCFDDTALKSHFRPPDSTELLGFTKSVDEAGFLFGKKLDKDGQTGELITGGPGGPKCKDAMLSVVVNRA